MTENKTKRWLDVLDQLVSIYNSTYHESIGMSPNEVNLENTSKIRQRLYGNLPKAKCSGLKPGDKVRKWIVERNHIKLETLDISCKRIPVERTIFTKGYLPRWSDELYEISRVLESFNICYFRVKRINGRVELDKPFYRQELNLVAAV